MIPRLILILLPFLLPTYVVRFSLGPLPTTLLETGLLALLAAWFFSAPKEKFAFVSLKNPWLIVTALWLLAGFIAVFVADNHIAAFGLWRAYFLEPILVFVMLRDIIRTDADKHILLRSVCLTTVGVAVWAVFQVATGLGIPSPWNAPPQGVRATGPFPFPNALALFVVPVAALCFHLALEKKPILQRAYLIAGCLGAVIATLLAKSDGGIVAIGAAAFMSLILKKSTRVFAVGAAIIGTIVIISIPTLRSSAENQIFFREWSGKVRLVMWDETGTMLRDRPFQGAGLGNFPTAIAAYHEATWMEIFQYPHNILLNLWSEIGVIGILAFGAILIMWLKNGKILAVPVMAALLVHGLVDVPYFKNDLAVLFWILIALTIPVGQNLKQKTSR